MTRVNQSQPSYLFTLRIWRERLGNGQAEWRGQIRQVLTGQVHYFSGWSALAEHLQTVSKAIDVGDELEAPTDDAADVHAPRPSDET